MDGKMTNLILFYFSFSGWPINDELHFGPIHHKAEFYISIFLFKNTILCLLNCIEKNSKDDENRTSPITGWEVALFSDSERYDENVIAEIKSKEVSLLCDLRYIVYIFSNINCA